MTDDASVDDAPSPRSREAWGGLDFLVHAIGFADKEYLRGRYLDTPRDASCRRIDISAIPSSPVASARCR